MRFLFLRRENRTTLLVFPNRTPKSDVPQYVAESSTKHNTPSNTVLNGSVENVFVNSSFPFFFFLKQKHQSTTNNKIKLNFAIKTESFVQ